MNDDRLSMIGCTHCHLGYGNDDDDVNRREFSTISLYFGKLVGKGGKEKTQENRSHHRRKKWQISAVQVLEGYIEVKKSQGRPRRICGNNVKEWS